MKKNLIIYLTVIGLIGLFAGCEKDGTNVVMSTNPIAPTIKTMPNLALERSNGNSTLVFVGTPVDPGFQASVNYFLEACASGDNFANPISIVSSIQAEEMKITVSDLNGILLKSFPADQVSTVDFRIRARLVADAGTGVEPFMYNSATTTAEVTLYGLPRLNLIGLDGDQKIESALGDGVYFGYVKLDVTKPFTLLDPDANIVYGDGGAGTLAVDGPGIPAPATGYHKLTANTSALTYKMEPYMIALIGNALLPNGWDGPDTDMDYDPQSGTWYITTDLVVGFCKFRLNDSWGWNMGLADSGVPGELKQGGVGNDIPITEDGNYTLVFTILNDNAGTYTITKN
jgi:hypothetical protein